MKKTISTIRALVTVALMAAVVETMTVPVYAGSVPKMENTMEEELLQEINTLRNNNGLSPLEMDESLTEVAAVRAKEASQKWSHTRPNGKEGVDLVPGNVWKGENLSTCMSAGDEELTDDIAVELQFSDMCHSKTHRENMLFDEYERVGIYTYKNAAGKVTTAYMFAS